ncbi:hypothetical protein COCOBI_04-6590 [Coccomyxa sp. Obi]|nr:hypothetical protein COCOBI_04-6590 [Coccomyxa sp. Obi]
MTETGKSAQIFTFCDKSIPWETCENLAAPSVDEIGHFDSFWVFAKDLRTSAVPGTKVPFLARAAIACLHMTAEVV